MKSFEDMKSLEFAVHQYSQSLKSFMSLLFTEKSEKPLIDNLDALKQTIGQWGLDPKACEELILSIAHVQTAIRIQEQESYE